MQKKRFNDVPQSKSQTGDAIRQEKVIVHSKVGIEDIKYGCQCTKITFVDLPDTACDAASRAMPQNSSFNALMRLQC